MPPMLKQPLSDRRYTPVGGRRQLPPRGYLSADLIDAVVVRISPQIQFGLLAAGCRHWQDIARAPSTQERLAVKRLAAIVERVMARRREVRRVQNRLLVKRLN